MVVDANADISPEDWQKVSTIFGDLLEVDKGDRERYLRQAVAGTELIEFQVRRLLLEHDHAGQFLETPLLQAGSPATEEPGRVFEPGNLLLGRFRVQQLLGAGGMGEVYEAFDCHLRQDVALKTLRMVDMRDPSMLERFRVEVLRSRQITHENVGRVYDSFIHTRSDGVEIPFFTMELLRGRTLSQWLAERGPLSPLEALPLLRQMAAALAAAHLAGIVHRDFKPSNIFLSETAGRPVKVIVTDFGIAAEAGLVGSTGGDPSVSPSVTLPFGTPAYMAPEQLNGEASSHQTDVYAFGLVAFEMLTGRPAYPARSSLECALRKLAPGDPVLFQVGVDLPPEWIEGIHRCVRRDSFARFESPLDFLDAISGDREKEFGSNNPFTRRHWLSLVLTVVVSASAALLLGQFAIRRIAPTSIAVLPFENLNSDRGEPYFGDGLAEELTHELTAYPKLHVAAQNAAFRFRDKSVSLKRVSQTLGVEMILTGSVLRSGNHLRIAVQLVRGTAGIQVWSQIYERDVQQIFAIQSEITSEIASRLSSGPAPPKLDHEPTPNINAYDLYLKGRYLWNGRTHEGMMKSLDYFRQAISLDGRFALAYSGLADAYLILAEYGWLPSSEVIPQIRAALQHSLALEPNSAETMASLGMFDAFFEWDAAGAERAFHRSLTMKPSLVNVHTWYGDYLMRLGRLDEALSQAETATRLDPVSSPTLLFVGWVRYYRREYPRAIEVAKQVADLNPSYSHCHQLMALSYAALGFKNEALHESELAVNLTSDRAVALRYRALVLSRLGGLQDEARRVAAQLAAIPNNRQDGYLVTIYAALRDPQRMYEWTDRALAARDSALLLANVEPALDPYRNDPHLLEAFRQLGLATK